MTTTPPEATTVFVEKPDGQLPSVTQVTGLGHVANVIAFVGSSPTNEKTFIIRGFNPFATSVPATIQIQPRQSDNHEHGFPDEFAVQVIETDTDHIRVRIKRLDGTGGWGQNLRLDILIIGQVHH